MYDCYTIASPRIYTAIVGASLRWGDLRCWAGCRCSETRVRRWWVV